MDIPGIDPYLFQIGNFGIRWYGFFMAISIGFSIWYFVRQGKAIRLSEDFLYNLALITVISGVIGARLVYVITSPAAFIENPALIPRIDLGGLSFHGAISGGALGAWWYARRRRVPLLALMDWAVPGIALGIMLVRIANIFNREILGLTAEILGGSRHPVQLYGSAVGVLLLLIYMRQSRDDPPDGVRFWTAALVYSVFRGIKEMFKAEPSHYFIDYVNPVYGIGFMTMTQWLTPLFVLLSYFALQRVRRLALRWRPDPSMDVYEDPDATAAPPQQAGKPAKKTKARRR